MKTTSSRMAQVEIFHDTRHAKRRSVERDLRLDDLKNVVKYGQRASQQCKGEHGGLLWKFKKTVGGETLVAIAEVYRKECWIISGWVEKP